MSTVSRNIVFNLVGQVLNLALGFWGVRTIFRQLGDEALGILYFAIALTTVLTPLIDLGVSAMVVREVARRLDNNKQYVIWLSRTCTLFYWCSYLLLVSLVWWSAPWLVSRWIRLKTLEMTLAVRTLRFLALGLLLILPRSLYANLLRGVERMEFNSIVDVSMAALRQGGTILVVVWGGGLVGIAYFYFGCFALNVLAYFAAATRFFPWSAFLPGFSREVISENASFTTRMGAYTLLGVAQMESDKAILSKLLPIGLLGFYGMAQATVLRANQIPGAVMQAALPKLSALFHQNNHSEFLREYSRLQDLVCFSTVPIFAAILFTARPVFTYLLNAQAAGILVMPIVFLCFGFFMNGTLNMPSVVAVAAGRPDIGARQNLYALFLVTPITIALIWKWGVIGAGLSVVIYHLFAYSYGARRIAAECLRIAPSIWYLHVLKVLALALVSYGAIGMIVILTGQISITGTLLAYTLASIVYLYLAYWNVGEELREGISAFTRRFSTSALRATSSP